MMDPVPICRGSISFFLIVAQLSLAYGALNVEPTQTSGGPSSPLPAFPGSGDGGFTGNLGLSIPEDPMVDGGQWKQNQDLFNNEGNLELASGGNGCTPGASGRGKRRARRSDPLFCPLNLQHPEAGQQQGGSQGETPPPKMQEDPPQIPGPQEPNPDTPPILLEQLDVPQPDSKICPWGIASIPICARWENADVSQDILPGMGFISDFRDIVHWNRYYPGQDCPDGESLFCCHFVKPQPILQHSREEDVPEIDLSSPLDPFDGWFSKGHSLPAESVPERPKIRDYTATLCRPGPSDEYPGPRRTDPQSH